MEKKLKIGDEFTIGLYDGNTRVYTKDYLILEITENKVKDLKSHEDMFVSYDLKKQKALHCFFKDNVLHEGHHHIYDSRPLVITDDIYYCKQKNQPYGTTRGI